MRKIIVIPLFCLFGCANSTYIILQGPIHQNTDIVSREVRIEGDIKIKNGASLYIDCEKLRIEKPVSFSLLTQSVSGINTKVEIYYNRLALENNTISPNLSSTSTLSGFAVFRLKKK